MMLAMIAMTAVMAEGPDWSDEDVWLCRPGRQDACAVDQDATVIEADGAMRIEAFEPADAPEADCFYVYPTVSLDETDLSDLSPGDEERAVIASQFARFAQACRTYAPMYRQTTLTALRRAMTEGAGLPDGRVGYSDVSGAFAHYLEHDNQGRPFVLIGHSQGARMLQALVANEIDGSDVADRMLSAMLIGYNVLVPEGENAGGEIGAIPLCRSAGQTGCAISYVSFRDDVPPPENARFGRSREDGMAVGCTNPADLAGGGPAALHAYLGTEGAGQSSLPAPEWAPGQTVETGFVSPPGLLTARCVSEGNASYLAVSVTPDPDGPRTDQITGDVMAGPGVRLDDWGLHLVDVSIAQGDLISLVESQTEAWLARNR